MVRICILRTYPFSSSGKPIPRSIDKASCPFEYTIAFPFYEPARSLSAPTCSPSSIHLPCGLVRHIISAAVYSPWLTSCHNTPVRKRSRGFARDFSHLLNLQRTFKSSASRYPILAVTKWRTQGAQGLAHSRAYSTIMKVIEVLSRISRCD
jgi:hypothetical protein